MTGVNSGTMKGLAVPAPLVTPVVLTVKRDEYYLMEIVLDTCIRK
jgi:hypothetical protein